LESAVSDGLNRRPNYGGGGATLVRRVCEVEVLGSGGGMKRMGLGSAPLCLASYLN